MQKTIVKSSPHHSRSIWWSIGVVALIATGVTMLTNSSRWLGGQNMAHADEERERDEDGERAEGNRRELEAEVRERIEQTLREAHRRRQEAEELIRDANEQRERFAREHREREHAGREHPPRPERPDFRPQNDREERLMQMINEMRHEIMRLRRDVDALHRHVRGQHPDRPPHAGPEHPDRRPPPGPPHRDGDRPREGDVRRDRDRPREGEVRRDGDRPREGDARRDADRPRAGDRDREK